MDIKYIASALTGDRLMTAISETKNKRTAIAEDFLYEQSILMIAADPGTGKSTISTQVAVELSAGLPVFGIYPVHKPVKVLYVQTERNILEILERLEAISKVLPINKDNLVLTGEYQMFNLLKEEHVIAFIDCVKRDCPDVKVIFIDPIYCMVSGGLSKDEPAAAFTKGMNLIQKETGAIMWYNHHTVKSQYDNMGRAVEKEDPFYGSQWLKAHVTGSYFMKKTEEGVKLVCKKDNYNILPKEVVLEYNPQTELCLVPIDKLPALDRVKNYVRAREIDGKSFSFKEMQQATEVCSRTLRKALTHSSLLDKLVVVSSIKNRNLYKAHTP